jgi:hypothetical protein
MPEKSIATVIMPNRPNMLLESGINKDGTHWIAVTNKDTMNRRYLEKNLTNTQLGIVLASYLALSKFYKKRPTAERKDIIKYLKEVITI